MALLARDNGWVIGGGLLRAEQGRDFSGEVTSNYPSGMLSTTG